MPSPDSSEATAANLEPTAILDYGSHPVQEVVRRLADAIAEPLVFLRASYRLLRDEVRPIYTVDELQPTSLTLEKGAGSCSQRFACLESLARAGRIPTRVRGLWIAGGFWNPRFRLTRSFIPARIFLAWPQFFLGEQWLSVEELFDQPRRLAERNPRGFSNDAESLFDVLDHVALDFDGKTAACGSGACDLSGFVVGDTGIFASRDDAFVSMRLLQHTLRGRLFEWLYGGRSSRADQ